MNENRPKKETMKKQPTKAAPTASQLITNQIAELNDWRGAMLAQLRKLIHEADPELCRQPADLRRVPVERVVRGIPLRRQVGCRG